MAEIPPIDAVGRITTDAGAIDVFSVGLIPVNPSLLSASEQARVARFISVPARTGFVATRAALRIILSRYLGVAPQDIPIVAERGQAPVLENGRALSFSVSHSGAIGLIGVVRGSHRVGVDIEQFRRNVDVSRFASQFLHPGEAAAIGEDGDRLFECWTRKEAAVKALGMGLSYPLRSFCVELGTPGPSAIRGLPGLVTVAVPVSAGYVAAIATDGDAKNVETAWF